MVRRPLATIAAIFAVLATLCVFLPWYSVTVNMGPTGEQILTHNGFDCDFLGLYTVILAGLGAIGAITVAAVPAASLPFRPRYVLAPAAVLLLCAFGLTVVDVFRDAGDCRLVSGGITLESGKTIAILVTLLGSLGAASCAVFSIWTRTSPDRQQPVGE